jgi:hypothetical protein
MADWIEGKSIPQVIFTPPITIDSPAKAVAYTQASGQAAAPGEFPSVAQRLKLLGNISYGTRHQYLTSPF